MATVEDIRPVVRAALARHRAALSRLWKLTSESSTGPVRMAAETELLAAEDVLRTKAPEWLSVLVEADDGEVSEPT